VDPGGRGAVPARAHAGARLRHHERGAPDDLPRSIVLWTPGARVLPRDVRCAPDRLRQRFPRHRLLFDARPRPELRSSCRESPVRREPDRTPLVTDLKAFIASRVPGGRNLERRQLVDLATAIGSAPELWREQVRHDPGERVYVQLYRDPYLDVWMICWL